MLQEIVRNGKRGPQSFPASRCAVLGERGRSLEDEIRITVLHELAHYFGLDEDRLDELGYG